MCPPAFFWYFLLNSGAYTELRNTSFIQSTGSLALIPLTVTVNPNHGLNNRRGSTFCISSRVQQETPEEGWRTHQPKRCEYNNKDEDNSPNVLNDKNHQAASQKFRKLTTNVSQSSYPIVKIWQASRNIVLISAILAYGVPQKF